MSHHEITCLIGLSILTTQPVTRVNAYRKKTDLLLFGEERSPKETHVTVIPAFRLDENIAKGLHLGFGLICIGSVSRFFCIKGMEILHEGGESNLVFPVTVYEGEAEDGGFRKHLEDYRARLLQAGIDLKQTPSPRNPYILIKSDVTKAEAKLLRPLIAETAALPAMHFQADHLALYVRHKDGYRTLPI